MKRPLIVVAGILLMVAVTSDHGPKPYAFPELHFFPEMPVSVTNPVTEEGVDLGRHLFYDPILSQNQKLSCASCHRQAQAFSDAPKVLSNGKGGATTLRNTMPLFNLAWYPALFWDGRAATIEAQVLHPVRDAREMALPWTDATRRIRASRFYRPKFQAAFGDVPIDSTLIANAIGQFMRTLISHRSKFDRVLIGEDTLATTETEGFVLMNDQTKGDCLHCHTSDADALGTTRTFSNNGLDGAVRPTQYCDAGLGGFTGVAGDYGKFKIPSLRNVALTAPYMHDGRFATLEEVLQFYSTGVKTSVNIDSKMTHAHQGGVRLTQEEQGKIIAFLHTLTDSAFVTDPAFGNPFE